MKIVLLLLLISSGLLAQETITVKGSLIEKGTRKILSGVNVYLLPMQMKGVTNEKGEFEFTDVPMGDCQLIINHSGYDKLESNKICDTSSSKIYYLEKKFYTSFESTVTTKVKRDDNSQTLTQEEFIKAPGSFGGDPVRAAQNLPGVAQNGGSAEIIVQGASPDDTGYLINGHRVPIVFHFGGLSSVIIPEAVERVELFPSGYGPEYSRAIGGIIGLTTKDPKNDRIHGMAFVDLLNMGALVEGPVDDKSSFLVSGRYSYIGEVLKQVAKENEDLELTAAPTFFDLTGIYNRTLDDKNKFKTTMVFSKDELELVFNKPAGNDPDLQGDFYNRTEFFRVIPQVITRLNEKTSMDNSIGFGKDRLLINISGRYLDINTNVVSQRSELVHEWSSTYKTYVGLDNQFDSTDSSVNLPNSYDLGGVRNPFSVGEERKFDFKEQEFSLGAYLRQEIKPSEDSKWTFLPNLRLDHFTWTDQTIAQPRFQLRHQWDQSLLLRGSVGQYVQPPRPQETIQFYGNTKLDAPYALHYTVGFTKDFRDGGTQGLTFTNNYFYKDLRNLVIPDSKKNYNNSGTGNVIGSEIQAKYRFNEWAGQVVYTYLKSERKIPGFGTAPSEFDQTHNVNLIASYTKERWTYGARFRYVTGNAYTPIVASTYDTDNDVYIPVRGDLYSRRFESFQQFDIRIDRKYIYDRWILTAYLDIQNILNSSNSSNISYSYDYSEKDKVRGLPILPTIGVKGEF